jgi:uncharacterized protein YbjT (DUF2867 family)
MSTDHKLVLVAGATGRLSRIVEVLLERGHTLRAMTRNADSPGAERLRALGAEIVFGDFERPESIEAAAAGADAAFATGTAHRVGPDGELRHGRNLADAVAAAGVPHLVYSSGDGAAPDSTLPLFRAKVAVEKHIRSLPIASTILAPVYFMENLLNPWNHSALEAGVFPSPIAVDVPLQQIALADLVGFAALAIERPAEFAGQRIALASDELTALEAARALQLRAEHVPPEAPGLRALFGWLERDGHHVDIAALQDQYPDVDWHDYSSWAAAIMPACHSSPA